MSLYRSMYSGIHGQAHACNYHSNASQVQAKPNAFDDLQNSIREHRELIHNHYSDLD